LFIVTARVPRRALKFGGVLAALLCAALLLPPPLFFPPPLKPGAPPPPNPKGFRTTESPREYLIAYGWEISPEPIATQELLIPAEMDESYQEYLTLQSQQGFSLEKYAGQRVKRYTYEVYNYPSGESGVQANLLIHRNTVVGGEILSPKLDGFLHGLAMP